MTSRSRRDQALALAATGLMVFPLPPNSKEPYSRDQMDGLGWKEYMTSEPSIINMWFDTIENMNYAVTGGDKFLIVDEDNKGGKTGSENFAALNMEQPADDWCLETFTVKSPSGGRHRYLRVPYGVANSVGKIAFGVDIRGQNGYVVGPGCFTTEVRAADGKIKTYQGDYTIETETEMQEAPQWLLDKCDRHYEVKKDEQPLIEYDLPYNVEIAKEFLSIRAPAIEGSGGDQWTYETCAKVKDKGISPEKAFELMMAPGGWNSRCEPPWSGAELRQKIENAYHYGQNAPGNKGDLLDAPGAFTPEEYLADLQARKQAARHALEEHLFTTSRILTSEVYREMVIPEWLIATGFTALLAERGVGKSVQMVDMACRIACNMSWYDIPVMENFASIYICGEDDVGARDMFRAWTIHNRTQPDDNRFFFLDTTCDLLSRDSVELWAKFLVEKLAGRRAVVFLDTWQRATSSGSQSDDVQMQTAIHHVDALAKSVRGPVVIAAHPPKSGQITVLGSSVIENSTSGIWHLENNNSTRTLRVARIKGKGFGNYVQFDYKEVNLNRIDDFGRPITGIIPERIGGTTTKGSAEELKHIEEKRAAYASVIHDIMQESANEPNPGGQKWTLNDIARRIDALKPGSTKLIYLARNGIQPSSYNALVKEIETLFTQHGGNFDLEIGYLTFHTDGRKRFSYKPKDTL